MTEETNPIPEARIRGSGRLTIPGLGEARISGSGNLSPEEIRVSGSSDLPGGIKARSLRASGSTTIRGDVEAESIDLSGSVNIRGAARFGSLEKSGSLRTEGPAHGSTMRLSGSTRMGGDATLEDALRSSGSLEVGGDLEAGNQVDISGAFRVEGKVKTRRLEARLHNSTSRIGKGIEAERVDIRPYERGFRRQEGELTTTKILGVQEVSLENVECEEVYGGRVTIGEGCTVRGRVLYTESIEVHPNAHVAGIPEKVERLPP